MEQIFKKFYYDPDTRIVENHCFLDEPKECDKPFIMISEEEWNEKLWQTDEGYGYKVNQDKLEKIIVNPTTIRIQEIENQIATNERYLSSTDYIIIKLQELQVEEDSTFSSMKAQYAAELQTRKDKRAEINTLQTELRSLQGNSAAK